MKNEGAYTLSIEFEPFDVGDVRIQRLLYKHLLTLEATPHCYLWINFNLCHPEIQI